METLESARWDTPSLCAGWTVRDVAAHLAWALVQPLGSVLRSLLAAGLDMNRLNQRNVDRWSREPVPAILEQLRSNAHTLAGTRGMPREAVLGEAVMQGLDIRRPLGLVRQMDPAAFVTTVEVLLASRWPMNQAVGGSARRRFAGARLVATDLDWASGDGPDACGPADAVLLLLGGRSVDRDEFTGPGASRLRIGAELEV